MSDMNTVENPKDARSEAAGRRQRRSQSWGRIETMENPTDERRNVTRQRVLKGAQITFKGRGATIDCMVRNLSDGGACLKVASPIGIPDTFDLLLSDASARHCRVTWRKATQIGVAFT
jgi:hypothetical protein